ncbi:hypothetical protein F8388_010420 [Cannabis sativa]|uniref:RNase H type-1 domain-containing protein n=1 Tax=Cannabis sativa TaxID=3483 RepID=A0A7J6GSF5_CANSA|nr:hypothetical protein F8388_010420 [Cannabis sativa]
MGIRKKEVQEWKPWRKESKDFWERKVVTGQNQRSFQKTAFSSIQLFLNNKPVVFSTKPKRFFEYDIVLSHFCRHYENINISNHKPRPKTSFINKDCCIDHIAHSRPFCTKDVTDEYFLFLQHLPIDQVKTPNQFTMSNLPIHKPHVTLLYLGCVTWEIWRQRNNSRINHISPDGMLSSSRVRTMFKDYSGVIKPCTRAPSSTKSIPCSSLIVSRFSVFTDASWCNGKAGIAAILVNHEENTWFYSSQSVTSPSPLDAEAQAILYGLSWASKLKWEDIVVFSDCQVAISGLEKKVCIPDWRITHLSYAILDILNTIWTRKESPYGNNTK